MHNKIRLGGFDFHELDNKPKFLFMVISFLVGGLVMAADRYVTPSGSPAWPYTSWGTAATTIQDAVNASGSGDVIWVTNGTYYCWSNSSAGIYMSMVTVTQNITIQSVNGPAVTIVDANYPLFTNRCFYITSNAIVSGFTITNGHVSDVASGGGVFINGSGMVTNGWITGNVVTDGTMSAYSGGGGVYCSNGGEVVNCQIYGNIATNLYEYYGGTNGGAGVGGYKGGIVRDCAISNNISFTAGYAVRFTDANLISNCTIVNNQGGGVRINTTWEGSTTVDVCRIIGNTATNADDFHSGGLWLNGRDGYKIARNCWISENSTAHRGGGVLINQRGLLSNCIISNNYAKGVGGGVVPFSDYNDYVLVENCTILNNRNPNLVGGVYLWYNGTLRNCLIAGNSSGFAGGIFLYAYNPGTTGLVQNCTVVSNTGGGIYCAAERSGGGGRSLVMNTIVYSNSVFDWYTNDNSTSFTNCCTLSTNNLPGSGNITNWPDFIDYSAGNYRLHVNSPCVNSGLNQDWMTNAVDLDSRIRVRYGTVDRGAYEIIYEGTIYSF